MAGGSNAISRTAVWILLGLLIIGLGGFGVTSLGGGMRSVGSVGSQDISIDDYARILQQEIRAIEAEEERPLPFPEAQARGIDRNVLSQLVTIAAIDHEAETLGVSIGDDNLALQITDSPAFVGADGRFNREVYRFALDRAGLSEAAFEDQLRRETARTLLQGAVTSGIAQPDIFVDRIMDFAAQRRSITFARLDERDLPEPVPTATEADLRRFFDENTAMYTLPEMKDITYVWLTPDDILDTIEMDQDALRAAYEQRANEFNMPERRLVERLAMPTAERAAEAMAQIAAGETTFDDLVAARGLSLVDVDLGDLARSDLGAAAETIFAASVGQVVGPLDSAVGPALFRVNGKLDAQVIPFEEALPLLRDTQAIDRARRELERRALEIDSLLVGGATLEELVDEAGLQLARIDWHRDLGEGISGYTAFREAAAAVQPDDFPQALELEDGGVFALRMNGTIPPRLQDFDTIRDQVAADWRRAQTLAALRARAADLAGRLSEGMTMEGLPLALEREEEIIRGQFIPGTRPDFVDRIFDMAEGQIATAEGFGAMFLIRLDAVLPPDDSDPAVIDLRRRLAEQTAQGLAQDIFTAFAADIQARTRVQIDPAALNAVHSSFQ